MSLYVFKRSATVITRLKYVYRCFIMISIHIFCFHYLLLQVKKPTFEEVKSIHTRLSTVTFQPRGTVDDDAPPLPALPSESSVANSVRKEGKSLVSVPILPFNRSSRDLFAACLSGDTSSVAAALQDITKRTLNGSSITDETVILEDNHSSGSSGRRQSDSNHEDNSGSGGKSHSTVSPLKHLPGIQEEEVERQGEDNGGDAGTEGEVEREDVVLDLKGILDLPESLESLSTCLHLAAEKGMYVCACVCVCVCVCICV
jgi:hypothetical protein